MHQYVRILRSDRPSLAEDLFSFQGLFERKVGEAELVERPHIFGLQSDAGLEVWK
jgi:hypothetical protein